MKRWEEITIDFSEYDTLLSIAERREAVNPACRRIFYWKGRMDVQIEKGAMNKKGLEYGFVGDGWPIKSDQSWALKNDTFGFAGAFSEHCYRDVGDAIYQANRIYDTFLLSSIIGELNILDFGSGYGRLAIPFVWFFEKDFTYFGLDAVPISLLIAPQFVEQATGKVVLGWNGVTKTFSKYDFISLPAWRIDEIEKIQFNCFISTHSFQEMSIETIEFYIDFMDTHAAPEAIFYCINLNPERIVMPDSWEVISEKGYPINRDGSFNEMIWRKKS